VTNGELTKGDHVGLSSSAGPLIDAHDGLLLDLDGVLYVGPDTVLGATEALNQAASRGVRLGFVTNNASRDAADVAARIASYGLPCVAEQVMTSAQLAATWLADRFPQDSAVMVVGGEGLHRAVARAGLSVVTLAIENPIALVQGFGPDVGWRELTQASFAICSGATWVATNLDLAVSMAEGMAPANGALVQSLVAATGRHPDVVTGKPSPEVFVSAADRWPLQRPLVVGDYLDTDIAGARAAGVPSLLVMTGVTGPAQLLSAPSDRRPDYIGMTVAAVLDVQPAVTDDDSRASVGGWLAAVSDGSLNLVGDGQPVDALRAAAAAAWRARDARESVDDSAVVQQLQGLLRASG
jgi:glycerol-1-phosphatase